MPQALFNQASLFYQEAGEGNETIVFSAIHHPKQKFLKELFNDKALPMNLKKL
jgi:hypothetical protein